MSSFHVHGLGAARLYLLPKFTRSIPRCVLPQSKAIRLIGAPGIASGRRNAGRFWTLDIPEDLSCM